MIEARRRETFHVPGEPLVVSSSPIECMERFAVMSEFTGLGPEMLLSTPLVTTPLPRYPADWSEGSRRWSGTRPEAMWHPLMWLPRRVAHRYTLVSGATGDGVGSGADAERRLEGDDAWALRVCLELASAGLYDEETGTWLDMLSSVGIDVEDDADLARVQEWLEGAADPVLDGIDLTPVLLRDEPDWAVGEAAAWMPTLRVMVWGTHAEAILEYADALIDAINNGVHLAAADTASSERGPIALDAAKAEAASVLFFAVDAFSSLDAAEDAVWASLSAEAADAADLDALRTILGSARKRLQLLAELFVPVIEDAARIVGAEPAQFAGAEPLAGAEPG